MSAAARDFQERRIRNRVRTRDPEDRRKGGRAAGAIPSVSRRRRTYDVRSPYLERALVLRARVVSRRAEAPENRLGLLGAVPNGYSEAGASETGASFDSRAQRVLSTEQVAQS